MSQKRGYQKEFMKYGESSRSIKWKGYKPAAIRYRQLVEDLTFEGKSILDVGCGMGDLLPYICAKTLNFSYLGVDITPEFIDTAKKRYEGHDFKVADPITEDLNKTFDIVISSGTMNSNVADWQTKRKLMITKLFSLAHDVLVFNMAGGLGELPANNDRIAYANAREITDFCLTMTSRLILRAHYHPRDFTILMFK